MGILLALVTVASTAHLVLPGWKCGHVSFGFTACLHGRLRFKSCSTHCLPLIAPTRCLCFFGENFLAFSMKVRNPPMHRFSTWEIHDRGSQVSPNGQRKMLDRLARCQQ